MIIMAITRFGSDDMFTQASDPLISTGTKIWPGVSKNHTVIILINQSEYH